MCEVIGSEHGEDVAVAGGAERKKRGRSVRMLPHPRPRLPNEPYLPPPPANRISIFRVVLRKFRRIKFGSMYLTHKGNDYWENKKKKRGPKPNHLKIDDENWEDAVKKAIQKKKPKNGWPKKNKDESN